MVRVKITRRSRSPYYAMYYDDPVSGQRHQRSTKTTDAKEATKAAGAWEKELNDGSYRRSKAIDWRDFVELFLDRCKSKGHTTTSYSVAFSAFRSHVKLGQLSKFTDAHYEAAVAGWEKEGLAVNTIANYSRHLRAALKWAVKKKFLLPAVLLEIDFRTSDGESKGRPISKEEFERMLTKIEDGILAEGVKKPSGKEKWKYSAAAKERSLHERRERAKSMVDEYRRLMLGAWHSGMRLDELLDVTWDGERNHRVDLKRKRILFRSHQKSRKEEEAPMTPDFWKFLNDIPESERTGYVFKLKSRDKATVSRTVARIGEAAGVVVKTSRRGERYFASLHDLRRSWLSQLATRVMPTHLQRLARHASIQTTMRYYVGIDCDRVTKEVWDLVPVGTVYTSVDTSQGSQPETGDAKISSIEKPR